MQISTKNTSVLIFSDVHQNIDRVERIINAEKADINLCLGDWFDSFVYDTDAHVAEAAKYLKYFVQEKNCYSLWANHDVSYLYPSIYTKCSGYEKRKFRLIMDVMGKDSDTIRQKLLWHVWIDDILCTHAGLHQSFLKFHPTKESVQSFLEIEEKRANEHLLNGSDYWVFAAGRARGGWQRFGGLNWLDFNQEFEPIEEIPQIVGHTTSRLNEIRAHHSYGGFDILAANDLCIDCHLNEYLVITNGVKEIKKYADL